MNTVFNLIAVFSLLVIQTTLMPLFHAFDHFYDLMIPLVIYLGLMRSLKEALPTVILIGFGMDALTGGPFGVYMTAYIWICIGVNRLTRLLHARSGLLWLVVVPGGVLVENSVILCIAAILNRLAYPFSAIMDTVAVQLFWGALTGPIMLTVIHLLAQSWQRGVADRFVNG